MPRNGSNVYSPPAGTTATTATTIESAKYNAFVSDLTTLANEARPVSVGGTGATAPTAARANLGLVIGTDVQAQNATLSTIASQGNVATGQIADNAVTTAKVANGAITDAKLINPAGTVLLARKAASGATVEFTEFNNSVYGAYTVILEGVEVVTGDVSGYIAMRISRDGGATYETTDFVFAEATSATSGNTSAILGLNVGDQADAAYGMYGEVKLYRMGDTLRTGVRAITYHENTSGNFVRNDMVGQVGNGLTHNAIQFTRSLLGDFNNGWFSLYGHRKA